MVVPSIRCSILKKLDSSIAATFDKYLMVPLGSSLARASNNNRLLTHRTSCAPLHVTKMHNIYNLGIFFFSFIIFFNPYEIVKCNNYCRIDEATIDKDMM
jgi:hypothetical protein